MSQYSELTTLPMKCIQFLSEFTLGKDYFASFNIPTERLIEFLDLSKDAKLISYAKSILLKDFNGLETVDFKDSPIVVNVDAILGEVVTTQTETFVPLIVLKFTKVSNN